MAVRVRRKFRKAINERLKPCKPLGGALPIRREMVETNNISIAQKY